jgi:hypothetical protein
VIVGEVRNTTDMVCVVHIFVYSPSIYPIYRVTVTSPSNLVKMKSIYYTSSQAIYGLCD